MASLTSLADNTNPNSAASGFRSKRMDFFKGLIADLPKPVRILDIGGTPEFWKTSGFTVQDVHITLVNLQAAPVEDPMFSSLSGNATDLCEFKEREFKVAFSNSVIEHLYTWENQNKMAQEAKRVAEFHFIQTPNFWFPVEPHWVFPFFQYLPTTFRIFLTQHFNLGHIPKLPQKKDAKRQVEEIRLLTLSDLKKLFPKASIYREKFLIFNKSFVAHNF